MHAACSEQSLTLTCKVKQRGRISITRKVKIFYRPMIMLVWNQSCKLQISNFHSKSNPLLSRLRCIVTCIGPNRKNQPNLDLYLVRRYKICHFPLVVSYLCIGQNQKNQPNLVLYLVQRSKIFLSVATLHTKQI